MDIFNNPVILAIIVGMTVFILMSYLYKDNKKTKNGKKGKDGKNNKKNNAGDYKETIIIVSAIASLGTWYLAYSYLGNTETDSNNIDGKEKLIELDSKGLQAQSQVGGGITGVKKIPSITSEDATRSYNLLGCGLNIPRSELKIPSVLIDYN